MTSHKNDAYSQPRKNSMPDANPTDDPSKWSFHQKLFFDKGFSFGPSTRTKSDGDDNDDLAPDEVARAAPANYARAQKNIKELYERTRAAEKKFKAESSQRRRCITDCKRQDVRMKELEKEVEGLKGKLEEVPEYVAYIKEIACDQAQEINNLKAQLKYQAKRNSILTIMVGAAAHENSSLMTSCQSGPKGEGVP